MLQRGAGGPDALIDTVEGRQGVGVAGEGVAAQGVLRQVDGAARVAVQLQVSCREGGVDNGSWGVL